MDNFRADNPNKNKTENKEQLEISVKTISGHELIEIIYKGNSSPQDKRFLPYDEGGVFKYFDIGELIINTKDKFYSLVMSNNIIIGLGEIEKSPYEKNKYWIKFISVDSDYQNKGYASELAKEIFHFAKQAGIVLEASSYSLAGYEKLKPLFRKLAKELSVEFVDNDRILPK